MCLLTGCMPVIADLGMSLTVDDVTSSWGPRRSRLVSPRVADLLSNLLALSGAENWIQPKLSFKIWPVIASGRDHLDLRGGSRIASPGLAHHLPGAAFVAAGVCTLGDAIEKRVSEGFASGDRLRAVMLDEIGTLALFRLSDDLERTIQVEAKRLGLEAGGTLNPGEDGFDISQQAALLELADGASIGISQTAVMLAPRKSISMLIGIGAHMPKWTRGERCAVCAARDRCPHRRSHIGGASK